MRTTGVEKNHVNGIFSLTITAEEEDRPFLERLMVLASACDQIEGLKEQRDDARKQRDNERHRGDILQNGLNAATKERNTLKEETQRLRDTITAMQAAWQENRKPTEPAIPSYFTCNLTAEDMFGAVRQKERAKCAEKVRNYPVQPVASSYQYSLGELEACERVLKRAADYLEGKP